MTEACPPSQVACSVTFVAALFTRCTQRFGFESPGGRGLCCVGLAGSESTHFIHKLMKLASYTADKSDHVLIRTSSGFSLSSETVPWCPPELCSYVFTGKMGLIHLFNAAYEQLCWDYWVELFREFEVFLALSRDAIILNAICLLPTFHSFLPVSFHSSQGHINPKVVV